MLGVESCWLKLLNFDSALVVGEEDLEVREDEFLSHWKLLIPLPDPGRHDPVSWTVKDGKFCAEMLAMVLKLFYDYF